MLLLFCPTGYGKSLIFHLLPDILEKRTTTSTTERNNIVIVVSPLTSIIEDQIKDLTSRGVSASFLQLERDQTANRR